MWAAAAKRDEQPGLYATLLAAARGHSEDHEVEEQLDRDLHRTFPGHPALTEPFCQRIKNVLLAYSARNPEVAYCQGMNFVTAAILLFVEEELSRAREGPTHTPPPASGRGRSC